MKKVIETLKEIIDEIKKDIDVYFAIQKYSRVARKHKIS